MAGGRKRGEGTITTTNAPIKSRTPITMSSKILPALNRKGKPEEASIEHAKRRFLYQGRGRTMGERKSGARRLELVTIDDFLPLRLNS